MLCSVPKVAERLGLSLEEAGQLVAKMPVLLTLDPRLLVLGMNGEGLGVDTQVCLFEWVMSMTWWDCAVDVLDGWMDRPCYSLRGARNGTGDSTSTNGINLLGRYWFQVHAWVGRQAYRGLLVPHKATGTGSAALGMRTAAGCSYALRYQPHLPRGAREDMLTCDLSYRLYNLYAQAHVTLCVCHSVLQAWPPPWVCP